ncbi:MAG: Tetratricopeptide repeat [Cyanobacteria bacterium RYN_339]|nr:Tetratricopeptide repeat [Cyanobacteria bacterium RYN_339]
MWRAYYEHLKVVAGEKPEDKRTPLQKGLDAFQAERRAEAVPFLRQALADDLTCLAAYMALGTIFRESAQALEAYKIYAQAVAIAPHDLDVRYYLGESQHMLGCHAEAEATLRAVLKCTPSRAEAHRRLGMVLMDTGRRAEALAAFDRAVYFDRHDATARFFIAQLSAEGKNYQRAVAQLELAGKSTRPADARLTLFAARQPR